MRPVEQQKLHDPDGDVNGDCMRAAWASILERPIEDLPEWEDHHRSAWWYNWVVWLRLQGWRVLTWAEPPDPENTPLDSFCAVGPSPRFDEVNHCVVHDWTGLVHDPHPGGDGLDEEPASYEWLVDCEVNLEASEEETRYPTNCKHLTPY